jgi:hypothetical protein
MDNVQKANNYSKYQFKIVPVRMESIKQSRILQPRFCLSKKPLLAHTLFSFQF